LPTPAIEAKIAASENISVDDASRNYLARAANGRFIAMGDVDAMPVFLCSPAGQDIPAQRCRSMAAGPPSDWGQQRNLTCWRAE
jgi:hypothetical protein